MAHNNKRGGKSTEVNRAPVVEVLEPRILFSADLPGIELFNAETTSDPDWHEVLDNALVEFERTAIGVNDDLLIQPSDLHGDAEAYELIIIDPSVEGYQTLIDSLREQQLHGRDLTWHVLDSERDGIEQLTELFSQHENLSAVHLFAHGGDGVVQLGESQIETSDINSHASEVSSWRHAFLANGDFLIYGCDLASSDTGVVLLETLAELTATDVAASENLTGPASQGGDWDLEYTHGVVEAQSVVSQAVQDSWQVKLDIPGVNDAPIFGVGDGIVTTDIGSSSDYGKSGIVQPDGKILVAGTSSEGGFEAVALVRYNVDGSLDTSFSGDGTVTTSIRSQHDGGESIALQSDGKILVAGTSTLGIGDDLFAVVRYNADGTLDTSFGGGDGIVTTDIGPANDRASDVLVQSDGKIIVTGHSSNGANFDFAVVRYNSDGTLDTSFSGDGMVTAAIGTGNDRAFSATLQDDGKILVVGTDDNDSLVVVRFNTNGTLDTSFSGDGLVATAAGASNAVGRDIAVQSDGKILVAGHSWSGTQSELTLVRYNGNGTLDTSFSGDGIATNSVVGFQTLASSVSVLSDGKILAAGYIVNLSDVDLFLMRYNSDGTLDTSFDGDGIVTTVLGPGDDYAAEVFMQPNGKILLAGQSDNGSDDDFFLIRYNSDGSLDTSFSSSFSNTLNGASSFTENGAAVVLDANVDINDAELDGLNSGNGNYNGASVALIRDGGVSTEDIYSFNDGNGITLSGADLIKNSQIIATFDLTTTQGELVITWTDANGETPTSNDVDNILGQITYANSSDAPPSTVQIDWTFDDGNTGSQGSGGALTALASTTVSITATNDDPTNAGSLPTDTAVTEDVASNVDLSAIDLTDVDAGSSLTITLTTSTGGDLTAAAGTGITVAGTSTARTLTGNLTDLNNYLNTASNITYLHGTANTFGNDADTIQVTVNDNGNTGAGGGTDIDLGTVNVDITAVNDAPAATADSYTLLEDGTLTTTLQLFGSEQVISNTSDGVVSVVAADVDGDGDLDVLVGSSLTDTVAWFQNIDGFGTFGAEQVITNLADSVRSVKLVDIDGDGDMDVLVASLSDDTVAWFENTDGLGTFGPEQVITNLANGANAVAAADVDGDGDLDVLVASNIDDTVAWFENTNGLGVFGSEQVITNLADGATAVVATDIDGDGDLDVLTGSFNDNTVAWFENTDGLGTFGAEQVITLSAVVVQAVESADVDGDGDQDVLVASRDDDTIAWFENTDGLGTFGVEQIIPGSSAATRSLVAADVDGDGDLDLLAASFNNNTVGWFENIDGLGTFDAKQIITNTADRARSVVAADVDGDGDLDVVVGSRDDDTVAWFENNGGPVLNNDIDIDVDPLTAVLVTNVSNGTLLLNADGTFTYTPDAHFNGVDSFTYKANDGAADSSTVLVTLNVTPLNDDPTNSGSLPTDIAVTEDISSNVDLSAINLADVDASSGSLTVTLSTSTGGDLTAAAGTGVTVSGTSTELTLTGNLTDLNNYLNTASNITYLHGTPETDGDDADTIQVNVNDNGNVGTGGGTGIDLGTVNVNITAVNDAPSSGEFGVYLSELTPLAQSNIFGGARFDTDYHGTPIDLEGVIYDYGITTHAPGGTGVGTIDYSIGDATRFVATLGVDDTTNTAGDVVFRVLVDGVEVYISDVLKKVDESVEISIDVTGGSVLRLEVGNADNHNGNDHAVWGNARLEGGDNALASIDENSANGTVVAHVTGNDVDSPDSFTFSLVDDAGGRFAIDSAGEVSVANGLLLDYDTNPSHSIDVLITDTDGAFTTQTMAITIANTDSATAIVVNQSTTVAEGASNIALTTGDLSSTDTDTDDTTLIYTVGDVSNGTLTISGSAWASGTNDSFTQQDIIDGNVLYTHDDSNTTADNFTYTVEDPSGNQLTGQTFSVTITAVDDDTPSVVNQSTTVAEGATNVVLISGDLSSTDTDTNDTTLIYTVGDVSNGTLTINGSVWASGTNDSFTQQDIIDGNVLYSHDDSNTTSDSFSYTIEDPTGNTLSGLTFSITVTAVDDDTPTVVNQSTTVAEGASNITLTTGDLSSTDTDTDDTTLIYTVGDVSNGTLTINGSVWASGTNDSFTQQDITDGNVLYSHNGSNTTSDSFSYTVEDPSGNQLTGQTFGITVTAVDDDIPTTVNQSATVAEGATNVVLISGDLSSTDTDTDDTTLIYTVGDVSNGALTINGSVWASGTNDSFTQQDIIDGNVLYTHDGSNTTADNFSYTVEDPSGNQLNGQTFGITVTAVDDDTPAVVNQSTAVSEGATNVALTSGDLSSTDTDTNDPTLIYTVDDVSNGTLTINGSVWASGTNDSFTQQDIIDGNVLYTHDDSNTTADNFTYTVEDPSGNQLTGQTFGITVTAVDDDTPSVVNQSTTVAEGATNVVLISGDLSSTDTDTNDTTLIYTVGDVSNGTLTINGSVWASGTNDSFTQQDIIDGNVLYSHDDSNTTSDSFGYTVEDLAGNQLTGQTFGITVTAVDDDIPTAVNQSTTVAEGATNIALSSGDLSSTDTDTNDTTLIYTVGDVSNGTLTINGSAWASGSNDSFTQQNVIDGNVLYSHDDSNTTSDSFSYTVEDPSGNQLTGQTFSVTVTAVDDDVPTIVNQSITVAEGATNIALSSGDLSSTDTDTNDTTLIYTVGDVSNGTLTISGSAWVSGTNDSFTQQDIIDGNILYSHDGSNTTADNFTYTVEDPAGNQLTGQTFSVTVTAVDDDVPTIVNQNTTVAEGATNIALSSGDLSSTDTDTDDTTLIYTVGDVSNGTLTINGSAWASGTNDSFTQQDIIDGNILYTHDGSNTTADSFTYTVEDPAGNQLTGQTFSVTVTAVDDDVPTIVNQNTTVAEGATNIALSSGDLSSTDTDTDDTTLIYTVGDVSNGTLTINGSAWVSGTNDSFTQQDIIDGNVLYSHDDSNTTSDSFSYTIEDPTGNTLSGQTFSITVTVVDDDTPTVVNQSTTVAEGASNIALTTGDLSSTDTDTDDTTLIYTVGDVSNGTLTINGSVWVSGTNDSFTQQDIIDGNVLYSHDDSNTTSDSFGYTVEDLAGNQLTGQTFGITVTAVDDDTPAVVNQSATVAEGATNVALTSGDLSSTDTDTNDTTLIYTVGDVSNGTLTINGSVWASGTNDSFTQQDIIDGNVLYSHDDSNTTGDSFGYTVEDLAGNQLTGETFGITVTAVDDNTPTVVNQSTTVAEGATNVALTSGDLSSTDTDANDTTLIYTVGDVSNGTLTINGSVWASGTNDSFTQQDIIDGNVLYSHDDSNTTGDSFGYTVEDLAGNQLTGQTFGITVTAVDDNTPTVVNQSTTVAEGATNVVLISGDLSSTDTDTDDTTLIYTVGDVSNGTLTINGSVWASGTNDSFTQQDIIDGNVLYSHDDSNTTSDSFSYTIEDPTGNTLSGLTFSITVTAVDDDTPTVVNQSTTVAEGASNIALTTGDLSSTDTDTDDTTLIYTVGDVSNGTLTINGSVWVSGTNDSLTQQDIIDGNVLYSHDDSNTTSDSFSYTVEDPSGNQLTGQTFGITVTAVDDDIPTTVNQSATVAEGATNVVLISGDLSSTDTDTDDTTLIYTVGDVSNGTLTINGSVWASGTNDSFTQQDIIDGNVLYSHDDSNTTSDSFGYTVEDLAGNQLTGQTFGITVTAVDDDTPAVVNQSTTVAEGATNVVLISGDLSSTDTDTNDTTLIYTVGDVSNGTLTISGSVWASGTNDSFTQQDIIDGNVLYTHDGSNTAATDGFTYTVEDPAGNQLAGQSFSLTITAIDDDIPTAVNQSATVAEGATNVALTIGDLSSSDSDTDDTTLVYTVGDVSNGTLTINGSVWVGGTNDSFTQQDVLDGNVLYSHDGSNTTADSFAYTVEDSAGNQLTGQTLGLTVSEVDDDTPSVVNQSTTVAEGATNIALASGDLSSTDTDTDDSTLIYVVGDVSNGTLTINGSVWASGTNDSFTQQDIIDGNVLYSHDDSNTTNDSFSYTMEDPSGNQLTGQAFGITVTAVDDDVPAVVNQSTTLAESATNIALTIGDLSSSDTDTVDSTLIYTVGDVSNGTLTINGSAWASGTNDSFTQQDVIDGNIRYTHDGSNTTVDSFTYTVEDPSGNKLAGQAFGITVTAVDDDIPTVVNQSTAVVEGATNIVLTSGDLSSADTDTDDTTLSYTVADVSNGTLTINGSVWSSGTNDSFTQQDVIDGYILYTHDGSNTPADSFTYTVEDPAGNQLAGQTFSITITAVDDDTPIAVSQSTTVAEGATNIALTIGDLSSSDTDADDSTLIYTVGDASNGTLTINGSVWANGTNDSFSQQDIIDGNVLYSHDDSNATSDSFSYTVEDPTGNRLAGQNFGIAVTAVDDDTATVVNQSTAVAEGASSITLTTGDLSSTDTDTDDTTLIYTVGNVSSGTLTINGSVWASSTNDSFTQQDIIDGNVLYTHDGSNSTSDGFSYRIEDSAGNQLAGQTFGITVTSVDDDAPASVNQSTTVAEGATNIALTTGDLSSTDSDTDDTTLIYSVGDVSNGTLTINGSAWVSGTNDSFTQRDIIDGNVLYSHDGSKTTSDSFSYTVEDPTGNTLSGQNFSITVSTVEYYTPTVVNQSTTLLEGENNVVLDTIDLSSTDGDTDDATLIYTVGNVSNGTLIINGSVWASGSNDTFTQQDIIDGDVQYAHNGSSTSSDSFSYTLKDTDGNILEGQIFSISVSTSVPGDIEPPDTNQPPTLGQGNETDENTGPESPGISLPSTSESGSENQLDPVPESFGSNNPEGLPVIDGLSENTVPLLVAESSEKPSFLGGLLIDPIPIQSSEALSEDLSERSSNGVIEIQVVQKPTTLSFLQELKLAWNQASNEQTEEERSIQSGTEFMQDLEHMRRSIDKSLDDESRRLKLTSEAVVGLGIGLSACLFSWMFRAGSLLASFLSVMPVWRNFDPLPVLSTADSHRNKVIGNETRKDDKSFKDQDKQLESQVEDLFTR